MLDDTIHDTETFLIPPEQGVTNDRTELSPFVTEIMRQENILDESQKTQILQLRDCLANNCPCSVEKRPYHIWTEMGNSSVQSNSGRESIVSDPKSDASENSKKSDKSKNSRKSDDSERSNKTDNSGNSKKSHHSGDSKKSDDSGNSEKSHNSGNSNKSVNSETSEKSDDSKKSKASTELDDSDEPKMKLSDVQNAGNDSQVKSLTSEVTPSATQFLKGLTKLAILPTYKHPGLICLALPAH